MKQKIADKIAVIGVDGFDPSLAKKFLDQGRMPNFQEFIRRGACRADLKLQGAHPTVTPPMWTTLATGAYPATHGITGFFNQHPEKLDTVVYALDSRMCKAEPVWNVLAESGKKTLVWHWPGSSWPPTSSSENLHVVDGTQPNTLGFGTAMIDWDKMCIASEDIENVEFIEHDSSEKGMAGCVITDLEDVVADPEKIKEGQITGAMVRKTISGGNTKEIKFLILGDSETEVNLMEGSNADIVQSPIKPAKGWENAPEGAKEFTILTSNGFVRRPCLILKNAEGIYDRVAIYRSKKANAPLITLEKGVMAPNYVDEILNAKGEAKTGCRCAKVITIAEDGSSLQLWLGHTTDVNNNLVWHPKSLHSEITEKIGSVPLVAQSTGREEVNVSELLIPTWDVYTQWQADCLNYLMDKNEYDYVFSHVHNVDAMGHKFWHYAKERAEWGNDETFYHEAIAKVYEQTDRYLGRFLHYLDEGWTIFILSDHGLITEENHPPVLTESTVSVPVMKELGYTVLKRDEQNEEYRAIDWEKTRAVATRGGNIYINLKGKYETGIVDPEDKYELEQQIISDLYNYRDPHTGKRVVALALRNKDAIILGLGGEECGDIVFFMEEGFNIIHQDSLTTQKGYFDTSVSPLFVAAGKGIKEGFTTDRVIRQVDIAPTIALLSGVRMPHQSEGSIVHQILSEEF